MSKIEHSNNAKQKKARTIKGTVSKVLIAAILICSLSITASAAGYSSRVANCAHGQILDKDGHVLKDVLLSENIETVQGDPVTTDIVLLDDGNYIYIIEEIEETAISTDAKWRERFNTLTPDQQARINFRPDTGLRESRELLPQETTKRSES